MRKKVSNKITMLGILVLLMAFTSMVHSHCQLPCGIYGDEARFDAIAEHITTIEKSMKLIEAGSAQKKPNMNQVVRWINNKENHADELSHIVTHYFMAQRVKLPAPGDAKARNEYIKKLTLLHEMLVYTMKTKQTTDLDNVDKLRSLLDEFNKVYFGKAR